MDRSDILTLISQTRTQDDYGRWVPSKTPRDVFVQVDSISRAEFYEAGRNGLNPEYRFRMFSEDYEGEELCEFNGQPYAIYRTYLRRDDTIELYVERKGGTNGADSDD